MLFRKVRYHTIEKREKMKKDHFITLRFSPSENHIRVLETEKKLGFRQILVNISDIKIIQNVFDDENFGKIVCRSNVIFKKGFPYKSLICFNEPGELMDRINSEIEKEKKC